MSTAEHVKDFLNDVVSAVVRMGDCDDAKESVDKAEANFGKLINFTHTTLLVDWCQDILPAPTVIISTINHCSPAHSRSVSLKI